MSKPAIGFIGLGIMGKPMSGHLLKAGYPLVVHNRSRGAVKELVAEGAQEARSCKEVAERSDVIISMVPDSPDVKAVALGPDGLIEGVREGQIYIDKGLGKVKSTLT
jgi:2-hydroxy-3-oxopropionate reductase